MTKHVISDYILTSVNIKSYRLAEVCSYKISLQMKTIFFILCFKKEYPFYCKFML